MPRCSLMDALRNWIDPEVLGVTALPMPCDLDARPGRCVGCGARIDDTGPRACGALRCDLPAGFDGMVALGDYDGPAGHAARLIKGTCWSDGAWWWGGALGRLIAAVGVEDDCPCPRKPPAPGMSRAAAIGPDAVFVPVPSDGLRTVIRGIDHAGVIARAASIESGRPWMPLLSRRDRTRQASRGARQRRQVLGRFEIKSKIDRVPERVVLVDDVCTTGSTAADCARALREAGADWVVLAVLARAHQ